MKKSWLVGLIGFSYLLGAPHLYAQLTQQEIESAKKQIEAYKKKIDSLEKQAKHNKRKIDQTFNYLETVKNKLNAKGFISAGIGKSDSAAGMEMQNYEFTNDWSANDTKVGIQMDFDLDEKFNVGTQISSPLGLKQEINMEWAYIKYKYSPNLSFRWGRSVSQQYYFSDVTNVAFAYPWIRPPVEVYYTPIGATEGIDVFWNTYIFGIASQFQFRTHTFDGIADSTEPAKAINVEDTYGLIGTFNKGYFTAKIGYSLGHISPIANDIEALDEGIAALEAQTGIEIADPIFQNSVGVGYFQLGLEYNDGFWWIISEYIKADVQEDVFVIPSSEAAYLTVGRRFGKFLPHVTLAKKFTNSYFNDKVAGKAIDGIDYVSGILTDVGTTVIPGYVSLIQLAAAGNSQPLVDTLLDYAAADPIAAGLLSSLATLSGLEEITNDNKSSVTTDSFDLSLIAAGLQSQAAEITGSVAQLDLIKAQAEASIIKQESITVGLRYDMTSKVAFKFDFSHYFDFKGTRGHFNSPDSDPYAREEKINVIGFTVDAIF